MKRLFAALTLLPMLVAIPAHAAISEIRKDFLNLTSLLAPTQFISAPGATGNYLVCVYLAQPGSENAMSAVLRWTDENNLPQSFTFSALAGPVNFCNPIRNHAGTAPTIETDGAYPGSYDLFVTGFGFWPAGTQGQGGITEPIHRQFLEHFDGILLTPAATGDYLVAISLTNGGAWTLGWTDSHGLQSVSGVDSNNGYVIPIHALAGAEITFSGGWPGAPAYVDALHFGTPAAGAGPITDYELNLLNYTNVKWPNYVNVFTSSSPGTFVFAGNIARVPGSGGPGELEMFGDNLFLEILDVDQSGAPGENGTFPPPIGIVGAGYRIGTPAQPAVFNVTTAVNNGKPGWGASGTYSAEVDVIKF
jgi:hypothetical protein